ncbi:hypothetical protein HMPREF9098_1058 [Kingella denitrificans ATCC 33394]|uniref:Uncharacterized protein n=1 Tax=Kingella denitrificans ATCC 33394 TaxID=888741 RepID=F0EYX4_9NEIS|nr:hypothetical protein HMPREF9098_1058 [Kingella denitrificans ATCC 33394]
MGQWISGRYTLGLGAAEAQFAHDIKKPANTRGYRPKQPAYCCETAPCKVQAAFGLLGI